MSQDKIIIEKYLQIAFCALLIFVTSRSQGNIRGGGKKTQVKGRTEKPKTQKIRKNTRKVTLSV